MRRHALEERLASVSGNDVEVGLFGLQISTSRVATVTSASIASRSWRCVAVERDLDRARAGRRRQLRVDAERRPRVDDLGAGLEQRLAGREQQVAGAVAERDPLGGDAVPLRQRAAQRRVRRVGIPVAAARSRRVAASTTCAQRRGRRIRWRRASPCRRRGRSRRRPGSSGSSGSALRTRTPWGAYCAASRSARSARASPQVHVAGVVALRRVVVDQHADHPRQRARHRHLPRAQQRHGVEPERAARRRPGTRRRDRP